jgi:DNA helicase II / ATP-dependent DNA helicase PcrA
LFCATILAINTTGLWHRLKRGTMLVMDFEKNYKQLNAAQKQAVDTIDGPVLVVAGPGTGKTQLLALRAANILQKTDTLPQNILCLTYTEVGARNMRERLVKLIGQAAYDIRISTYHGFGSDIIRQHAEYFNEYGADQPVDSLGQNVILQEIFKKLPASNPLWRADVYLKDALGFISECKRALLSPDDIRTIAKSNEACITNASKIITTTILPFARMNKDVAKMFIKLLADLPPQKAEKLPNNIPHLHDLFYNDLSRAIDAFNETGKTNQLTVFKNTWLEKDTDNNWVMAGKRMVKKLYGAADIYEQYLAALAERKLFDYDDMIARAIAGLEQHADLRFSLHEQYLYIMLDEFQDTNLAQLRLVDLLTNNPVLEGRPNVLAVGDDDQAIYSFQGAEVANMRKFLAMYADVKLIPLTDNYRSHSDILATAQNISSQIEERLKADLGASVEELSAKNSTIANAHISRQQFKSEIAQFDWVAHQISASIHNGTAPHEIAVIAPKHKFIEPLVPYLQALNIPIKYDKRENVLDDQHILELARMAELVIALKDQNHALADEIWLSVLSAEYWQLPTSVIWQLSWNAYENKITKNASGHWQALMFDNEQLKPIALFFARLSQIASTETLENMFDYLVGVQQVDLHEKELDSYTSPYFEFYFGAEARDSSPQDFTTVLSNLTVLRQHVREYRLDQDRPLLLQDLLDFINDYRAAGEKLLNTSPYHSSDNAVQLMTAYGSKGLEFDEVFVLAVQDDVWGMKARSKNNIISLPPNLQIIRYAGTTKDEKKRLFYVALTRAKRNLHLTSYSQNYTGKATEPLEFMNETPEIAGSLPAKHQAVIHSDTDVPAIDALQHFWTTRHAAGLQSKTLRDLVLPRLETFQLSATHINSFTDLVYGGPDDFFINTILRFPKAPTADGQYGNAVHETLEAVQHIIKRTGEPPEIDQITNIFTERLKIKRLSENDFKRQNERGILALTDFWPQWWHNFVPEALSEYNFKHEASFVGEAHLSGKLDQLLIDTETKTIRVVDFKTGKSHGRWTHDVKMHKYKQQLLFYKLLVEASHSFKGYEVNDGQLVFVEPDDNGKIQHLAIDYQKEDLERAKQLIVAVWKRIKKLDLPDTSQFSPDISGIVAFEDWLIENT